MSIRVLRCSLHPRLLPCLGPSLGPPPRDSRAPAFRNPLSERPAPFPGPEDIKTRFLLGDILVRQALSQALRAQVDLRALATCLPPHPDPSGSSRTLGAHLNFPGQPAIFLEPWGGVGSTEEEPGKQV